KRLIDAGRSPAEPAAVIERGTLPGQRSLVATLRDVAERAAAEGLKPPAITLVGGVARLAKELAWVERRPLHGRTVVVTRARDRAGDRGRARAAGDRARRGRECVDRRGPAGGAGR